MPDDLYRIILYPAPQLCIIYLCARRGQNLEGVHGGVRCRLAPELGRRVGGQGAIAFVHLASSNRNHYAVKFFFSADAFECEKLAACNPVSNFLSIVLPMFLPFIIICLGTETSIYMQLQIHVHVRVMVR
jgi:hypothetical protein